MTRICAWCKSNLGEKPGESLLPSHGICDECETKIKGQLHMQAVSSGGKEGGRSDQSD